MFDAWKKAEEKAREMAQIRQLKNRYSQR